MKSPSVLERLVYLAAEVRPAIPAQKLLKYYRMSDLVSSMATRGIMGTVAQLDLPQEQLVNLYERGKTMGRGDEAEFRILMAQEIGTELEARRDSFNLKEYLGLMASLNDYANGSNDPLIASAEESLSEMPEEVPIIKWDTGFDPFDILTGGWYQSIAMLMALPGGGKTSLMLSMMEMMRANDVAESLWFFETEIPMPLMKYRSMPCRKRTKFRADDMMFCGMPTVQDIIEKVREKPDPERIIFIDSPDVIAGGIGEGRRFAIEDQYRQLIRLKEMCKAVIVPSQGRRQDRDFDLTSASEAWSKSFYVDIQLSFKIQGPPINGITPVKAICHKNRFGPVNRIITFGYDYADLSFEVTDDQRARCLGLTPNGETQETEDW